MVCTDSQHNAMQSWSPSLHSPPWHHLLALECSFPLLLTDVLPLPISRCVYLLFLLWKGLPLLPCLWNLSVSLKTDFMHFILLRKPSSICCAKVHTGLGSDNSHSVNSGTANSVTLVELHKHFKNQYPHL